jgi:hypothetical protein
MADPRINSIDSVDLGEFDLLLDASFDAGFGLSLKLIRVLVVF